MRPATAGAYARRTALPSAGHQPLKERGGGADNGSMSHRCWNCGQRLDREVLRPGVMTAPRVYFHRVGRRRQRGYSLWGGILGAAATLWFVASVLIVMAR